MPQNPIHFFHGMGDEIAPYENTQIAYDTFVGQGAQNITLTLYPESLWWAWRSCRHCFSDGIRNHI